MRYGHDERNTGERRTRGGREGGDVQVSLRSGQVPGVRVMLRECEARVDSVVTQGRLRAGNQKKVVRHSKKFRNMVLCRWMDEHPSGMWDCDISKEREERVGQWSSS